MKSRPKDPVKLDDNAALAFGIFLPCGYVVNEHLILIKNK